MDIEECIKQLSVKITDGKKINFTTEQASNILIFLKNYQKLSSSMVDLLFSIGDDFSTMGIVEKVKSSISEEDMLEILKDVEKEQEK